MRDCVMEPALLGCLAILLFTTACNPTPADTRAADEQTIKDLDAQWAKTAGSHDLDGTVSYYTDDAVLLPPNAPIAAGKAAIRTSWASLLDPNISLSWQATHVDVSQSGDLAYLTGTYTLTMTDAKGKPVADRGKLIEVFRKQPDGKWKTVADMYNSDLPAS
jgi:uncharacterized protein (TIGR02246 family)